MRWLTRVRIPVMIPILAFALLAGPAATAAQAVTLKDLVDLKKAGISDAVLVALIDSDGTVFQLTATEVRTLRDAGFSDSLIISILNTAVKSRAQMEVQAAVVQQKWEQQVLPQYWNAPRLPDPVVADVNAPQPYPYPYPEPTIPFGFATTLPLASSAYRNYRQAGPMGGAIQPPSYVTLPAGRPVRDQTPAPIAPQYWGFGGQLRPDAFKVPGLGGGR